MLPVALEFISRIMFKIFYGLIMSNSVQLEREKYTNSFSNLFVLFSSSETAA